MQNAGSRLSGTSCDAWISANASPVAAARSEALHLHVSVCVSTHYYRPRVNKVSTVLSSSAGTI